MSARARAVRCCWPPRQLRGPPGEKGRQLKQVGDLPDTLPDLRLVDARDAQGGCDVLEDREIRIVDELLEDHRDLALLDRHAGHVPAVEPDLAGARLDQPCHQLHQGGLARQRRPEESVEAAGLQLDARLVDVRFAAHPPDDVLESQRHDSDPATVLGAAWPRLTRTGSARLPVRGTAGRLIDPISAWPSASRARRSRW